MTVKGRHVGARAIEASILTGSSKEIATQAIFATRKDFSNSVSFLSGNRKKNCYEKENHQNFDASLSLQKNDAVQLHPGITDPRVTEIRL